MQFICFGSVVFYILGTFDQIKKLLMISLEIRYTNKK